MNRRKFLKSVGSFLVAIPFLTKDHEPIIWGVDEVSQDGDDAFFQSSGGIGLLVRANGDQNIIMGQSANHYNCKCQLEWIETE